MDLSNRVVCMYVCTVLLSYGMYNTIQYVSSVRPLQLSTKHTRYHPARHRRRSSPHRR